MILSWGEEGEGSCAEGDWTGASPWGSRSFRRLRQGSRPKGWGRRAGAAGLAALLPASAAEGSGGASRSPRQLGLALARGVRAAGGAASVRFSWPSGAEPF